MLLICNDFAKKNLLEFSPLKSVVLLILPGGYSLPRPPNVYLGGNVLAYVDSFKYLGHIISADFMDDLDIDRERRKIATRGNILVRKFGKCTVEVKCHLFRTYCYQLYGCSLWSRFRQSILNHLQVCFNNILHNIVGFPQWFNASSLFEVLGNVSYSLMLQASSSENSLLYTIGNCDIALFLL